MTESRADDIEPLRLPARSCTARCRFTDLLVYGLVFMVPIAPFGIFGSVFQALRRHGRAGLRDRHGRDDVHRAVVLPDVAGVPDGRLGLHLRRPRHRRAGRASSPAG